MTRLIILAFFAAFFLSSPAPAMEGGDALLESLQGEEQALTTNEMDALKRQLNQCVDAQLKEENRNIAGLAGYAVFLHIQVEPDRALASVKIHDMQRYQADPEYRHMADIALRALHRPNCAHLDLPPEKYYIWKDIIVSLDIQNMVQKPLSKD